MCLSIFYIKKINHVELTSNEIYKNLPQNNSLKCNVRHVELPVNDWQEIVYDWHRSKAANHLDREHKYMAEALSVLCFSSLKKLSKICCVAFHVSILSRSSHS